MTEMVDLTLFESGNLLHLDKRDAKLMCGKERWGNDMVRGQ